MTRARSGPLRPPKIAVRERGKRRTAELLDAAERVFAATGFEAAVMSDIAAEAGASVGSLYQYFPAKEALAAALFLQYTRDFDAAVNAWKNQIPRDLDGFSDKLVSVTLQVCGRQPAWLALFNSPALGAYRRDALIALAETMRDLLCAWAPHVAPPNMAPVANTIWHLVRSAIQANSTLDQAEAQTMVEEMKVVVRSYLSSRLAMQDPLLQWQGEETGPGAPRPGTRTEAQ